MANKKADNERNSAGIPGYEASDELAAKYDIQPYLVDLLMTEPFFAEIMRCITKVRDPKMSTAGVTVKDGELYLFYGPKFMAALSPKESQGVLKHEAYHLIFQHCTSRRLEPHSIANWAGDLAINSIIVEEELPKIVLRPGKPLDLTSLKKKIADGEIPPEKLVEWQRVSDKIVSFPLNESMEWYFSKLMEDQQVSQTIQQAAGEFGTIDDHDGWGDMTDEERAVAQARIREALKNAVSRCDRNGQWGSVASEMRETLRKLVENSIDWKKLLQSFVGLTQRANRATTMRKINRKTPYIHPGVKRAHSANLAIFVDMSGSVGDDELERAYAVLGGLAKHVNFKFFPFDYTVDEKDAFEWKRGQKKPPIRFRSGGTSFIAVNEYMKKHKGEFDGHIIITDGEAENPGPAPLRRCWVLVPGTKLLFQPSHGDIVVTMDKNPNKKAQAA